ncbi:MAG: ankyrin repeat domain-containing protein [Myxococcota bacterium]
MDPSLLENSWEKKVSLREAVDAGDVDAVRAFVTANPGFVDARYEYGVTPLLLACKAGNEAMVRLLVDAGADIEAENSYPYTPLQMALEHQHADIALFLLSLGVDVNVRESNDHMPLYSAFDKFSNDPVRFSLADAMLERGADINDRTRYHTILTLACDYDPNLEDVRYAIGKGIDVSIRTYEGKSALMLASKYGNLQIMKLVLDAGALVNQTSQVQLQYGWSSTRDEQGLTALMFAAKNAQPYAMRVLLAHGADPNQRVDYHGERIRMANTQDQGRTALHFAAEKGDPDCVRVLLAAGADPSIADNNGITAQLLVDGVQMERSESTIHHPFSWDLAKHSEPPTAEEWATIVANHMEFLNSKPPYGHWKTFSVSGLPLAVFSIRDMPKEKLELQANLQLKNLTAGLPAHVDWRYCGFAGAWGPAADFSKKNLYGALLVDAYLREASFAGADLSRADLSRADLRGANFTGAQMTLTDFEGADLRGADFTGAMVCGLKLKNARLEGAVGLLEQFGLPPVPGESVEG